MPIKRQDTYLLQYAKNVYSQFGEDGILEFIFKKIPVKNKRWAVEMGAGDGIFMSNTRNLILHHEWYGVLIEANRKKFKQLSETYNNIDRVHCINKFVNFSGPNSLEKIFNKVPGLPLNFDLISVDIDGADYYIWESLKRFRPNVVVIEFNPTMPVDFKYVQKKDFSVHNGSSLLSLVRLGNKKGYELICCTDVNAFFIRKEYYSIFKIKNNSPVTLFLPFIKKYQTQFWQGSDGTLHLIGCNRLLLHNFTISETRLQVLPKWLRFFPGIDSPVLKILQQIKSALPLLEKLINYIIGGKWELTRTSAEKYATSDKI